MHDFEQESNLTRIILQKLILAAFSSMSLCRVTQETRTPFGRECLLFIWAGRSGDGTEHGNKGMADAVEFGNSQMMAKGEREKNVCCLPSFKFGLLKNSVSVKKRIRTIFMSKWLSLI